MKRTFFKYLALFIVLCSIFSLTGFAESGEGWYLVKYEGKCPKFPQLYEFLKQHACYAIDEKASESGDKVLYLTFDAGYENGNIERILDTLKSESVPAAFFILSNLISKEPALVKRMADEGHLVCNHTKNHKNLTRLDKDEIVANLAALEKEYEAATGRAMSKYFRYPEGYYSKDTALICEEAGYKTFFWSMAYADWDNARQPSTDFAMKSLLKNTHPGAIVLLHPTSETNADIMPDLIRAWRSMGYRFGTLDDLVLNQCT